MVGKSGQDGVEHGKYFYRLTGMKKEKVKSNL